MNTIWSTRIIYSDCSWTSSKATIAEKQIKAKHQQSYLWYYSEKAINVSWSSQGILCTARYTELLSLSLLTGSPGKELCRSWLPASVKQNSIAPCACPTSTIVLATSPRRIICSQTRYPIYSMGDADVDCRYFYYTKLSLLPMREEISLATVAALLIPGYSIAHISNSLWSGRKETENMHLMCTAIWYSTTV